MPVINEFKQMWSEAFGDPKSWIDFFFERAYTEDDAVTLYTANDVGTVSALLLRRYNLNFHDSFLPIAYLCGACTRKKHRGKGYMGQLIRESLKVARDRGDAIVTLIPANKRLYDFYKQYDFAKAIYAGVNRYTSLHPFNTKLKYHAVHDPAHPTVAEAFCELESRIPGRVCHTQQEYLNILEDIRLDGGSVSVVADEHGEVAGFAFGVHFSDGIVVKDVIARDNDAATGALRGLRAMYPNLPFKEYIMPSADSRPGSLVPRGMARIINPLAVFEVLAACNPAWSCRIKVNDTILPENTGTYTIKKGLVTFDPNNTKTHLDYNVDPGLLTLLVFASPRMGEMIGFPSQRLYQALLLD